MTATYNNQYKVTLDSKTNMQRDVAHVTAHSVHIDNSGALYFISNDKGPIRAFAPGRWLEFEIEKNA